MPTDVPLYYRQTFNISSIKSRNLDISRLVVFAQSIEARYWVENADVVGAELTSDHIWVINNFVAD